MSPSELCGIALSKLRTGSKFISISLSSCLLATISLHLSMTSFLRLRYSRSNCALSSSSCAVSASCSSGNFSISSIKSSMAALCECPAGSSMLSLNSLPMECFGMSPIMSIISVIVRNFHSFSNS